MSPMVGGWRMGRTGDQVYSYYPIALERLNPVQLNELCKRLAGRYGVSESRVRESVLAKGFPLKTRDVVVSLCSLHSGPREESEKGETCVCGIHFVKSAEFVSHREKCKRYDEMMPRCSKCGGHILYGMAYRKEGGSSTGNETLAFGISYAIGLPGQNDVYWRVRCRQCKTSGIVWNDGSVSMGYD